MTTSPKRTEMRRLKQVGNYAVGIEWGDGHDSILPYRELRTHCPCNDCKTATTPPAERDATPNDLQRLGDATLFFRWGDGHETLLVAEELRDLCRCAYCAGEPNYPITNQ